MKNSQRFSIIFPTIILLVGSGAFLYYFNIKQTSDRSSSNVSLVFPKTDFDPSVRFATIPKETFDREMAGIWGKQSRPCSVENIKSLLDIVKKAGPTIDEFDTNKTISGLRGYIAFAQLLGQCPTAYDHEVHGISEFIFYLSSVLNLQTSSEIEIVTAGSILASVGQSQATQVLIDWVRNYKGDASELIYKWLVAVRDGGSSEILFTTIKLQLSFANNKNKDAFRMAAKNWCGFRSGNLQPKDCKELGFSSNGL